MRSKRFVNTCCLLLTATAHRSLAQSEQRPVYAAWLTAGWNGPVANGSNIGHDRTLLMAGLERRFALTSGRFGTLSFAPGLLPAVNATNNRELNSSTCPRDGFRPSGEVVQIRGQCYSVARYSAFGVGMLPLAFRWQTSGERRVGVSADLDGGGILFDRRLPVSAGGSLNGTLFNFTARGGIDGVFRVSERAWLSAGYRHVHLSNGGLGDINPGIDAPLMALGVAWR